MPNKFYVTTAIPYINAAPHIGHALEFVYGDIVARYQRICDEEVYFLTGTDDNSLKNVQAAEKEGIPIRELVDKNSKTFSDLKDLLELSNDDFIRTIEKRHVEGAQKLWKACEKDIYKKSYKGLYCVGCEEFKREADLVDGYCPEHPNQELQVIEEENYFFKLSKYQKELEKIIEDDVYKIVPVTRKNEVLSFIRQGLEDFSISRSKERAKGWGIPVPGDDSQVIYVWFDALSNYINALGYAEESELYKKYWPADVHIIGKGIIKFHAIYWPGLLLSAGIKLPKELFVHGYLTIEGQKISKSLGNVIDPNELVKKYGADVIRYFLAAEFSSYQDGDFSNKRLEERYDSDLASGVGNLVQRVGSMINKYFDGEIPAGKPLAETAKVEENYHANMKTYRFEKAVEIIRELEKYCDQYVEENKPWELVKTDNVKLAGVLGNLTATIKIVSKLLMPIVPETAGKIDKTFSGKKVELGEPLFPRLEN